MWHVRGGDWSKLEIYKETLQMWMSQTRRCQNWKFWQLWFIRIFVGSGWWEKINCSIKYIVATYCHEIAASLNFFILFLLICWEKLLVYHTDCVCCWDYNCQNLCQSQKSMVGAENVTNFFCIVTQHVPWPDSESVTEQRSCLMWGGRFGRNIKAAVIISWLSVVFLRLIMDLRYVKIKFLLPDIIKIRDSSSKD